MPWKLPCNNHAATFNTPMGRQFQSISVIKDLCSGSWHLSLSLSVAAENCVTTPTPLQFQCEQTRLLMLLHMKMVNTVDNLRRKTFVEKHAIARVSLNMMHFKSECAYVFSSSILAACSAHQRLTIPAEGLLTSASH